MISDHQFVVFYDGHCALCNRVIQWLLSCDTKDVFRFASLQSNLSQQFFNERNLDSSKMDTVILWKPNKAYWTQSSAFFHIVKQLGWQWRWLLVFSFFPKILRDSVYSQIAKKRLKWFGSYETCPLPDPSLSYKFLS